MLGVIALVAYRKRRKAKQQANAVNSYITKVVSELSSMTGLDYKTLLRDEDLIDLIGIDTDWDDLLEYLDETY